MNSHLLASVQPNYRPKGRDRFAHFSGLKLYLHRRSDRQQPGDTNQHAFEANVQRLALDGLPSETNLDRGLQVYAPRSPHTVIDRRLRSSDQPQHPVLVNWLIQKKTSARVEPFGYRRGPFIIADQDDGCKPI